ncbi:MAG: hypothetical protein ACPL7O_11995, partial [Armatimonadota bacterium]
MLNISGTAKIDKKTKRLAARLSRGDIAVIDHVDLDSTCARMLVEKKVSCVVNAGKSISGRYPNTGPSILLEAGIPILDDVGPGIMTELHEGDEIRIENDTVFRDGTAIASGKVLSRQDICQLMEDARRN